MHPLIKKFSFFFFILIAIYSSITFLETNVQRWDPEYISNNSVYDWDSRLSDLRADLPSDITVVGYVSEWDVLAEYSYPNNEVEYVLTQYTLAPVIVARDAEREWLIVNLNPKDFEAWRATQPADIQVTHYSLKLFLVHKP